MTTERYLTKLFISSAIALSVLFFPSCGTETKTGPDTETLESFASNVTGPVPSFSVGVRAASVSPVAAKFPYLQSFARASYGDEILLIGGRREGFHGLSESDTTFKSRMANDSIWVINTSNWTAQGIGINLNDPAFLQFSSSNMEFCQSGDTLFLVGGYGKKQISDYQSNYTYDQLTAISISQMIQCVKNKTNPANAIFFQSRNPFYRVTGGELFKQGAWFYLIFGQNYQGNYQMGTTGAYTEAIRGFKLLGPSIADSFSIRDPRFHRRDLPIVAATQNTGIVFAAYGGVFTSNDDGYLNPVYIYPDGPATKFSVDTLEQKTSQYACAHVEVYDPSSNTNISILLGGIGQYQYHENTGIWENGDNGAKLPFVKTITQMIYQDGKVVQNIQLPPKQPDLPALIGSNALFVPFANLMYNEEAIDYSKLTADTTVIGVMYGGILSQKPTSSMLYPTRINNTLYEVILYKN